METVLTILLQVVTMLLLAAVGYLMFRAGKISAEAAMWLSMPSSTTGILLTP